MKKFYVLLLLTFVSISSLYSNPFTPGNIVVLRVGDGSIALSSASALVFLDEYTTAGSLVQTIQMPVILSGVNKRFVISGTSTSEGNLSLSADRRYLTLTGYDTIPGTAAVATTAGILRVVGLVDYAGAINTSTNLIDGYLASNIRASYTLDGSAFWLSGTGGSSSGGVRYEVLGGTSSVQVSTSVTNTRFVYVYNNQLYVSSASGAFLGVSKVGVGMPIGTGETVTNFVNTGTGSSSYGFALNPAGTVCYIADDRTVASGGGAQKWTFDGTVWTLAYTLSTNLTGGVRGMTVDFSGPNPVIFVTNNTQFATVTDAGSSSAFTLLTTAATNTVFRGVSFSPSLAAPAPPLLVSPVNNSTGNPVSLNLVWNRSTGASTYKVQLSTDSLFSSLILNDSTVTDSVRNASGLQPLTNYWWRVSAKNAGGSSSFSSAFKFRTLGAPGMITGTFVPANGSVNLPTTINFRWPRAFDQTLRKITIVPFKDNSETISNYWYELTTDSVSQPIVVRDSTLTDTLRIVSGLLNSTNYYWRVKAKNEIGWGQFSYWQKLTTVVAAPAAPTLLSPANGSVGITVTPTLLWSIVPTAVTYELQVSTDSLWGLILLDTVLTADSVIIPGILPPNTSYWWRVRAANPGGNSPYSAMFRFTTGGPPPPPVLISPANNAFGIPLSTTLVWHKSLTAITYRVQLSTDSLFNTLIVNDSTLTDSIRSVSGLIVNTNYWWRVNAKNGIGIGLWSQTFKFNTNAVPPPPVLFSPPNNSTGVPLSTSLIWYKASTAVTYRVQLSSDSLFNTLIVNDSTLTDSTKAVSGLTQNTPYWWRVNAKNAIGTSTYSTPFKFTTTGPPPPALVTLKVIPGGFYNTGTGKLNMRDTVRVYLVDSASCLRLDSNKIVVDSVTFTANLSFTNAPTGNYYLFVYHRNHLPIASRFRQTVTRGSSVSYDFTTDSAKAFGFNMMKLAAGIWGMIPGDANRDEFIDGLDQTVWILQNGLDGYFAADFNGDSFVDGLDQTLWAIFNGNSSYLPCSFLFPEQIEIKAKTRERSSNFFMQKIMNERNKNNNQIDSKK
jgi:hypothetical protein